MNKGKVKWYNDTKGFGFIESEDGEDIFVHRSGIVDKYEGLQPDQKVAFNIKAGDKGPIAIDVEIEN